MSFEISKAFKYLESSLKYRAIRQDLIAGNIANADTPYYKSRDIDFESMLSQKAAKEFNLDLSKSLMFGDKELDIKTGQAAGCKSFLIQDVLNDFKRNGSFSCT